MNKKLLVVVLMASMPALFIAQSQMRGQEPAPAGAAQRELLDRYCVGCHNQKTKNGLALDDLDVAQTGAHAEAWERVVRKMRAGMMPPSGAPRPAPETLDALILWLENELDRK